MNIPTTCSKWIRSIGLPTSNMNHFLNVVKSNILPFIVAVILFGGCCTAWYLFHPASPYHKRYTFVVRYEAIGTLSPGNRVEVRGITKGQITKVELTDDAVFVTAEVLADTKIPKNSGFRLITAGLMGEREMCVLSGDATEYIVDGDTVMGIYDKGTSGISKDLFAALESLVSIKDQVLAFKDTVTVGSVGKRSGNVYKKGVKLLNATESLVDSWKDEANGIIDQCDAVLQKARDLLNESGTKAAEVVEETQALVERVNKLIEKLKVTRANLKEITSKLEQDDNTAGALMTAKGRLISELDGISADIDALVQEIKNGGLKLNVDIF